MRKRYLLVPCALAVGLAPLLLLLAAPRPWQPAADRTPAALHARLARAGLCYRAAPFGGGALLFYRKPVDLDALGDAPGRVADREGVLLVCVLPEGVDAGGDDPGALRVGPLLLRGHPGELRRAAEALGLTSHP